MNSILLTIAAFLVLVLGAAFGAPYVVDWNEYRDVFEAHTSRIMGHDVHVRGQVNVRILPAPYVRIEDVQIGSQSGQDRPLARMKSFTLWLSVGPLLQGRLEASEVELAKPELNLSVGDDGKLNWSGNDAEATGLPFAASNVAVQALKISNGILRLDHTPSGRSVLLDDIGGELSARGLSGPYKFAGQVRYANRPYEVRFASGRAEPDGSTRLKAVLRTANRSTSVVFDGQLLQMSDDPRVRGRIMALLDRGQQNEAEQDLVSARAQAPFELQGDVEANVTDVRFETLEVSLRRGKSLQKLTGTARLALNGPARADARLEARFLDVDALLNAHVRGTDGDRPRGAYGLARAVQTDLQDRLGWLDRARIKLSVTQAGLGGDVLRDLRVDLSQDDEVLSLAHVEGVLPGNARLRATAPDSQTGGLFAGKVDVSGDNLGRFWRWAFALGKPDGSLPDKRFSLSGRVRVDDGGLDMSDVKGAVAGRGFTGALEYRWDADKLLRVAFDADRLDLRDIADPGTVFSPLDALGRLTRKPADDGKRSGGLAAGQWRAWAAGVDSQLFVRIGELALPGYELRQVSADLALRDDDLTVREIKLASADGLDIDGHGEIADLSKRPQGTLAMSVAAADGKAIGTLGRILGLDHRPPAFMRMAAELAPAKLDLNLSVDRQAGGTAAELSLSGRAGSSDVLAKVTFSGEVDAPRTALWSIDAGVQNSKGSVLVAQLLGAISERKDPGQALTFEGEGTGKVRLAGRPQKGLTGDAALAAGPVSVRFDGRVALPKNRWLVDSQIAVAVDDPAVLDTLAGGWIGPAPLQGPTDLKAKFTRTDTSYRLEDIAGDLAGTRLAGAFAITMGKDRPSVDATLRLSEASLARLLAPLVNWGEPGIPEMLLAGPVTRVSGGAWPANRFDVAALSKVNGQIKLKADRLNLKGGLELGAARLAANLRDGVLRIEQLDGDLMGGRLSLGGTLRPAKGGFGLSGQVRATGVDLRQLTKSSQPFASGRGDLSVELRGEGLSPMSLVASLGGKGMLTLGAGEFERLDPRALIVVDPGRLTSGREFVSTYESKLASRLRSGAFEHPAVQAPLTLRDGVLRSEAVRLETAHADVLVTSHLSIPALTVDSEWKLSAKRPGRKEPLPPVTLVFVGPVGALGDVSPQIDALSLEHFLTIRRMERDVKQLEELDVTGRSVAPAGAIEASAAAQAPTAVEPPSTEPPVLNERPATSRVPLPPRLRDGAAVDTRLEPRVDPGITARRPLPPAVEAPRRPIPYVPPPVVRRPPQVVASPPPAPAPPAAVEEAEPRRSVRRSRSFMDKSFDELFAN